MPRCQHHLGEQEKPSEPPPPPELSRSVRVPELRSVGASLLDQTRFCVMVTKDLRDLLLAPLAAPSIAPSPILEGLMAKGMHVSPSDWIFLLTVWEASNFKS